MTNNKTRLTSMGELLDVVERSVEKEKDVSLGDVLDKVGHRSFGPLLLLAGLFMAAPGIGDIPGVPTSLGIFVLLVAGQMLFRRKYFWLPQWLLNRAVSDKTLCKAIGWLRKPARYIDQVVKARLGGLTNNLGALAIAVTCVTIALATPLMEVVPMSANVAGVAIAAFGVALVAHDGVVALFAYFLTATTVAGVGYFLL